MADRVKGITIEIGGDTTGLSKALGDVNKKINSTQTQLKDVERLLKLDPRNTELLAQKQKLLKDELAATKEKAKSLKSAAKQVNEQFKKGEISIETYQSFNRELQETKIKQDKVSEALKNAKTEASKLHQAFEDISKGAGKVADVSEKISDKLSDAADKVAPLSAAVVGVGVAGVKSISDMDSALGDYIAKTGLSATNTEYLRDIMSDIYANNYGEDFYDIADAMALIRKNIPNAGFDDTLMKSVTESAFALRDVFGYDVSESVRAATTLIDNFGLDGEAAFELIAEGAQSGLDFSGELLDSINEYSVQFRKFGFSAEDMFELFSAGAENGAFNLDKIGDAVKELSIRVIDGSDSTIEGFELLGLNADEMSNKFANGGDSAKEAFSQVVTALKEMDDPIAQSTAGVDLFGTMWEDLGPAVVTSLTDASETAYGMEDALNSIKEVKYDNLGSELEGLGRSIQTDIVVPLAENLMPIIDEVVEKAKEFVEKFSGMSEEQQKFVLAVGGVIVVLPGLLKGLSGVFDIVSKVSNGIKFLAAHPVVLLIAAIVALVAAIATKGDEIQALLQKLDDWLQGVFTKDWTEVFGPGLGDILNGFFANVKNIWDSIKKIFDGIIDFIRGVFTGDWERAWKGVKEIFGGVFDSLKAVAKAPLNGIIALVNGVISGINALIGGLNKIPGVNIGTIGKIPYLAKGGVLSSGSAIVGEAGPELLTVDGSRAVVQPLTNQTSNNYSLGGMVFNITAAPGQDVNELADVIAERIEDVLERREAVFA